MAKSNQSQHLTKFLKAVDNIKDLYSLTYHGVAKMYERDVIPTSAPLKITHIAVTAPWRPDILNQDARDLAPGVMNFMSVSAALMLYREVQKYLMSICEDFYTEQSGSITIDKSWFHQAPFNMVDVLTGVSPEFSDGFEFADKLRRIFEVVSAPNPKEDTGVLDHFDQAQLLVIFNEIKLFAIDFEGAVKMKHPKWRPI